ncbi:uncharacterized protein PHACADRAFT_259582 [Phanerochaete carnosa HHB-10118-sp]|uniref:NADP-dependent oxidoreductase domain-containing protein n=1 Tax=Phanerochaete carnosa (strain HHB-10118-sp) TaxID=650164 RepID=K5W337_PHACS|nr:uncharacterized protein PHACADRAFT_259582 [Phanerochaete carnosa HHB-10118-sp]EKM53309.1 hypothetical protein PHACADRAFT_259582 [Phanerochaete carnosa HHB-10118-sp]
MGWDTIKLNNGNEIPSIAYGSWTLGGGQPTVDHVDQALDGGFNHLDTAQSYRNELEVGTALHDSGLKRDDIFITTKYSAIDGLDIDTSIHNSLKNLGVQHVDLYLIHNPRIVPDIPSAWAQMEKLQSDGFTKGIGVSNFEISHLETLLASAKVTPAANQILLHPYVWQRQAPLVEYCQKKGIVVEAYSVLIPLTHQPGGAVDAPVKKIAKREKVEPEQVLLAWAKSKGVVVVTSSTKKDRLQRYLAAGDLKLTDEDIASIDKAGSEGARRFTARTFVKRAIGLALFGAAVLGACSYIGVDLI